MLSTGLHFASESTEDVPDGVVGRWANAHSAHAPPLCDAPAGWIFSHLYAVLKKIHDFPVDCSRWTPLGMKHFLSEAGFPIEAIKIGSWGNRAAVKANLNSTFFPYYNRLVHPLTNDMRRHSLYRSARSLGRARDG